MAKASSMTWKWQHPLDKNDGKDDDKHSDDDDDDSSLGSKEEDIMHLLSHTVSVL